MSTPFGFVRCQCDKASREIAKVRFVSDQQFEVIGFVEDVILTRL